MLIIVETGQISPPFGLNLFVMRSVAPDVTWGTVFRGVAPFCVADAIKLALVIAFPALALWLPTTAK
jgi:TRAP-type C4-dicarboxylate transport system permease large subunit